MALDTRTPTLAHTTFAFQSLALLTAAPAAAALLLLLLLELLVAAAGPAFVYAPQLGADPFTRLCLCLCLWTRFSLGTLAHFHLQLLYPPLWDACVCVGGGGNGLMGRWVIACLKHFAFLLLI